jgi:hypothetical protein
VGTWNAAPDELEAWDGDSTIKVGVCVQVRPGLEVSTPAATHLHSSRSHAHLPSTPLPRASPAPRSLSSATCPLCCDRSALDALGPMGWTTRRSVSCAVCSPMG